MVQPAEDPWGIEALRNDESIPREIRERLARGIEEHIARGNKPDHERAQRHWDAFCAQIAALPPTGRTEEEAQELIARYCKRRSWW
jgi:hypothetical protein